MNARQHLFIDALGQAGIVLLFSFMITKSNAPLEVLDILAIMLFFWQIVNAFLSYYFYEKANKATFVKITGWFLIGICAFLGILLMAMNLALLPASFAERTTFVIEKGIPYIFGIFALWYLGITLNDLYNMIYNRI